MNKNENKQSYLSNYNNIDFELGGNENMTILVNIMIVNTAEG